jgi:hypothetical protein
MRVAVNDDVVLTASLGGFPVGALGAVVALRGDDAEVEVIDRTTGETLGFVEGRTDMFAPAPVRIA